MRAELPKGCGRSGCLRKNGENKLGGNLGISKSSWKKEGADTEDEEKTNIQAARGKTGKHTHTHPIL